MCLARELGEDKSNWEQVRMAGDFEWDGYDDEDRPLSKEEMRTAINQLKLKEEINPNMILLKLDTEVLEYFRATGKGWQNHIRDILKQYVISHR